MKNKYRTGCRADCSIEYRENGGTNCSTGQTVVEIKGQNITLSLKQVEGHIVALTLGQIVGKN